MSIRFLKYIVLCAGMMVGVVQGTEGPNPSNTPALPENQGNQREKLFRLTKNLSNPNTSADDLRSWRQCFTKALPELSLSAIVELLAMDSEDSCGWIENDILSSAIKLGDIGTVDYIMDTVLPTIKDEMLRVQTYKLMLRPYGRKKGNMITDAIVYGRPKILSKLIHNTYLSKEERFNFLHEALTTLYNEHNTWWLNSTCTSTEERLALIKTVLIHKEYRSHYVYHPEDPIDTHYIDAQKEKDIVACLDVIFDRSFLTEEERRILCLGKDRKSNIMMWAVSAGTTQEKLLMQYCITPPIPLR